MNCYTLVQDAVEVCENYGKAVCVERLHQSDRNLCKRCVQTKTKPKLKPYRVLAALLGWLGAMNTIFLGFYVVTTCFKLTVFPQVELIPQAYAAVVATALSSTTMVYGSYLLWKGYVRKGGLINLAGGVVLIFTYTYFRFLSQPTLLEWLGVAGHFLLAPPILSAVMGLWGKERCSS